MSESQPTPNDSRPTLLHAPMSTDYRIMTEAFPKSTEHEVWTMMPRRRVRNPKAGISEARWYEEHKTELLNGYAKQWVAILGEGVIDNAPTFDELHERISARGIYGAFVQYIPGTPDDAEYFIA